jgi:hypothetical protein
MSRFPMVMSDSPPQHDRMSSGCEAGSRFTAAAGPAQPIALDARAFHRRVSYDSGIPS